MSLFRMFTTIALVSLAGCSARGIDISYSPAFDSACSFVRGVPIKPEWKEELIRRLPEFRHIWAGIGPALLESATQVAPLQAPDSIKARLTLCDLPSQSMLGISVNMRFALAAFTKDPVALRYKADTLFHEILHRMLLGHVPRDSKLLRELGAETACVRSHVHLLAVQKAVLLDLDETAALAEVIRIDGELPGGCYKRAWSIVNATETTYQSYVAELRN